MSDNITFVVGAGALVDWGFPTGENLKKEIVKLYKAIDLGGNLNSDDVIFLRDKRYYENIILEFEHPNKLKDEKKKYNAELVNEIRELQNLKFIKDQTTYGFISELSNATGNFSIDSFLNAHKDNQLYQMLGKFAIYYLLRRKEIAFYKKWRYMPENRHLLRQLDIDYILKNNWLAYILRELILPQINKGKPLSNICFIIFNYDRIVEEIIYWGIRANNKTDVEAWELFNQINIKHVYGSLGDFYIDKAYDDSNISNNFTIKGDIYDSNRLNKAINSIKIMYEVRESGKADKIKNIMTKSHKIYVLGFGYDELNLQNIMPGNFDNLKSFGGTAWGFSSDKAKITKQKILSICPFIEDKVNRLNKELAEYENIIRGQGLDLNALATDRWVKQIKDKNLKFIFSAKNDSCLQFLEDNL